MVKFNFLFIFVVLVSGVVLVYSVYELCCFFVELDKVCVEGQCLVVDVECLVVECYVQVINLCVEQVVCECLGMCVIMLVVVVLGGML